MTLKINLTQNEIRVLGSLIEKEITTPDQYPLSLNALTNACNQKSNRDPVLDLDQYTVQQVADDLLGKQLVVEDSTFGSRVVKYKHRFCNTAFGSMQFSDRELGIICVLFLRGPQTPGELRSRTNRLCRFSNVQEVETTLRALKEAEDGPYVTKIPREPGRRESRFAHLFSGDVEPAVEPTREPEVSMSVSDDGDRVTQLEQQVAALELEIREIRQILAEFVD